MVGAGGTLYAVDIHPLAVKMANQAAKKKGLTNIITMGPEDLGTLDESSIDVVILYDTLHDIEEQGRVLNLIGRLLKKGGLLSVKDHHLTGEEIESLISRQTALSLHEDKEEILNFMKK